MVEAIWRKILSLILNIYILHSSFHYKTKNKLFRKIKLYNVVLSVVNYLKFDKINSSFSADISFFKHFLTKTEGWNT